MSLSRTRWLSISALALSLLVFNSETHAESVSDPLTVVVGYAPGGASDRAARIVAEQLQKTLNVNVIVENKSGAGGRVAAQYMKSSAADNDMLMLGNPAVMVVAPLVYQNLPYDADADFKPVSMVTQYGFGVAVSADSPLQSIDDLVAWAAKHPEKFNVGVPATGSLPHFFGLMLSDQIGVDAQIIGYRGSAPVITDLIGGTLSVAIDTLDVLIRQHQGDRIRILATSGKEREADLPDVPTFIETGVDLSAFGWNTFFAPARMADSKVEFLGQAIKQVMADPDVQTTLLQGDLVPVVANASESAERIKTFREQWDPAIKNSGYVVEK